MACAANGNVRIHFSLHGLDQGTAFPDGVLCCPCEQLSASRYQELTATVGGSFNGQPTLGTGWNIGRIADAPEARRVAMLGFLAAISAQSARALDLKVPPPLLVRAGQVIDGGSAPFR